jgi:hypothetical protein
LDGGEATAAVTEIPEDAVRNVSVSETFAMADAVPAGGDADAMAVSTSCVSRTTVEAAGTEIGIVSVNVPDGGAVKMTTPPMAGQ